MRIHYYVHGRGRGHASRARAVVPRLCARGWEVRLFVGRDARSLLATCDELAHVPCESVASLPARPDGSAVALLWSRVRDARQWLQREAPAIVVSDGDLPSTWAARGAGVPALALGHGLVFSECRRPRGCARAPWWREAAKARLAALGARAKVAVNFVPLPVRSAETVLARPRVDLRREPPEHDVVCYFRDPMPAIVELLVARGFEPRVFAARDPQVPGSRYCGLSSRGFAEALVRARTVVATAGSQLLGECVALGVPVFGLHHRDDDEQRLNVEMLRSSGCGDGCAVEAATEGLERFFAEPPVPRLASPLVDVADAVLAQCRWLTGGRA